MRLERVNLPPVSFAYICATGFAESFKSTADLRETILRFERGECQLWLVKGRGFVILSWHDDDGDQWMEVEQGVGRHFYTTDGIEVLIALAKATECDYIYCEAEKPPVARLLKRLGFNPLMSDPRKMRLEIEGINV